MQAKFENHCSKTGCSYLRLGLPPGVSKYWLISFQFAPPPRHFTFPLSLSLQSLLIKIGVGQKSILCLLGSLVFSSSFYDRLSPQGGASGEPLSGNLVSSSLPYWRKQDQKRKMRREWDDYTSNSPEWLVAERQGQGWDMRVVICDIVIYKKNVYLVIQATRIFLIYTWSLFKVSPSLLPKSLEFPKCWET